MKQQGAVTGLIQKLLKAAKDNGLGMASMTVDGVTATVAKNDNRWQVSVSGQGDLDDAAFGMPEKPKDPVYPAYYEAGKALFGRLLEHAGIDRSLPVEDGDLHEAGWRLTIRHQDVFTKLVLGNEVGGMRVELWYDVMRQDGLANAVRLLGYELEEGRIK